MKRLLLCALVTLMLIIPASIIQASDNPSLVRVYLIDKTDLSKLSGLHLDIAYITDDYAEIVAYPENIDEIIRGGFHYEIVHDDLVAFYQSRNPLNTTMGGFLTFSEILDTVDALQAAYPDLVSERFSIGTSWEERDLWVFKISDNVDVDEDEPEVFYNSLIHAREPASWSWQLHYITWLLTNYGSDDEATEIVDGRELFFLPVFNPDGYEYNRQSNPNGGGMWRKNRRSGGGVDLNRNWGYMWGYDDDGSSPYPNDQTYRGPSDFSEPETQAVRDFIYERDFQFILNAHCYGNWVLYPFSYDGSYTPDHSTYVALGDSAEILTDYIAGTAGETLQYYANGESTDWQYGMMGIFSIVTETGSGQDGFWPSEYRIPQLNEQMLPMGKFISQVVGNIRAIAPPTAPVLDPIGDLDTNTFTITWNHDDEENPAVAYELIEKSGFTRLEDDFESGSDVWTLDGFEITYYRSYSGDYSLYSGGGNSYHGYANMADPITVEEGDELTLYAWYDIESDYDYAYIDLSTDGGATYSPIAGNITTNYNPHGNNRGNGITGSSDYQWVEGVFPLDDYVGMTVNIKFSYITDGAVSDEGIYFDDVYPVESFENIVVLSSDITENSYLIEDHIGGSYFYQVRARDAEDQWSTYSNREEAIVEGPVGISDLSSIPSEFNLFQNYPNPFNAQTEISFNLASPGNVELEIFDISGRLVRTLISAEMGSGYHQVIWDGTNNQQTVVSSGIYFYKLSTADKSSTKGMALLK
ncbi:MAG: T9SS type A sorting domain-containing protein [candidate division Zixibacteria bacterium]|nr:T9SS type A sorting domain-containing protein [candidate division Zixibacteria bacterium]